MLAPLQFVEPMCSRRCKVCAMAQRLRSAWAISQYDVHRWCGKHAWDRNDFMRVGANTICRFELRVSS
jgi:hypothetical protein